MSDDEIIAVVQAHKEGKQIEFQGKDATMLWHKIRGEPIWNFDYYDYRVAREPREWWISISPPNHTFDCAYRYSSALGSKSLVHVREVLE